MSDIQEEVEIRLREVAKSKIELSKYLRSQKYIFRLVESENGFVNYWAIHPDYYDHWLEGVNRCPEWTVVLLN